MSKYNSHNKRMRHLELKLKIAEEKRKERELKWEIIKTALPFRLSIKFSKFIVVFCIATIFTYTVAAILLQRNISMEISPTLTTCVYAFFGSELLGMVGIKIFDTKYNVQSSSAISSEPVTEESVGPEDDGYYYDDDGAVG